MGGVKIAGRGHSPTGYIRQLGGKQEGAAREVIFNCPARQGGLLFRPGEGREGEIAGRD